jgi:hypothetical protein
MTDPIAVKLLAEVAKIAKSLDEINKVFQGLKKGDIAIPVREKKDPFAQR